MSARKCNTVTAPVGTAEWVVQHSAFALRKGKNLSATFLGILEPRKALAVARQSIQTHRLVKSKGFALSKVHDDISTVLVDFLAAEPNFYALLDYDSGKITVDGWRPAIDGNSVFHWKVVGGRAKLSNGSRKETLPMRFFRARLEQFCRSHRGLAPLPLFH